MFLNQGGKEEMTQLPDRRSLQLTARARAKRPAQVRHGRQHVRCARVREHAGSITTPSTTTRPRRRPWQGGGRGAVECTWCMGVCSGAQLSLSPHRQPRARLISTRARARTLSCSATRRRCLCCTDTLAPVPAAGWGPAATWLLCGGQRGVVVATLLHGSYPSRGS